MMHPQIRTTSERKFIGQSISMTFANNKTFELWRGFMPRRNEIKNSLSHELFSIQAYDESYSFKSFNPSKPFVKWAAVEISDFDFIPDGMETFILPAGLYAVFMYKGLSSDTKIFNYIFGTWIPNSEYELDQRPHFEILGEKFKKDDPNSEEEIWIPIKFR